MKGYMFLLLVAAIAVRAVAEDLSEECQYVVSNYYLRDLDKVKKCFDTYKTDESSLLIDTIIFNLDIIEQMYPYVDIAQNPPSNPSGYFKAVNYTSGLEELKGQLKSSGGVISKIFRPAVKFVNSFHDGHFSLTINSNALAGGILSPVFAVLPFTWDPVVEGNSRHVFIQPNEYTDPFIPGWSEKLQAKYDAGVYASKVDDKDAFEFFADFLGEYNEMKSRQGAFFGSLATSNSGFSILNYPLDDLFDGHTITFSDGSQFAYHLAFENSKASVTRENTLKIKNFLVDETAINETEIIDIIQNFDKVKRDKRDEHIFVDCGLIGDMNYVSIPTFDPASRLLFITELVQCIEDFDENDKPITVVLPSNGGGSLALMELVQFLLMPTSDSRTLFAARKTITTRFIGVERGYAAFQDPEKCEGITNYELAQFWKDSEYDDFGNGIIHTRTKKFVFSWKRQFYPIAKHSLKKHIRKPSEIIIATDGYCFSACAFFVDNCIRSGSAIVAGYGVTMPGDEKFVAAQCPSTVISPADYIDDLSVQNSLLGLTVHATFLESYNISEKMKEIIPGDYDILRIDKHSGYNKNINPVFSDLLKHTTQVYEEFKTKCNPVNKRLLLVSDKCESKDKNALYSGYVCGSNGEWDKETCKISSCKPGYIVDFDKDKCVPNPCDLRAASNGLYPMVSVLVATLAVAIHSIF